MSDSAPWVTVLDVDRPGTPPTPRYWPGWAGEIDSAGHAMRDGEPPHDWPVMGLRTALQREYLDSDAHAVCYHWRHIGAETPERWCYRLKKEVDVANGDDPAPVAALGYELRFGVLLVDVDDPGKVDKRARDEWRAHHAELRAGLPADLRAGMGWYDSRGGYRLCWFLPRTVGPVEFEATIQTVLYQLAMGGIWADTACRDWTRLYRLPMVLRGGEMQRHAMDLSQLGAAPLPPVSRPAPLPTFERDTHHGTSAAAGHRWTGTGADGSAYGLRALDLECAELAGSGSGRNDALNRAAFAVAQLVAGGELDGGHAERCVLDAAESAAHNTSDGGEWLAREGRRQIRATMDSGWRAGLATPRSAPNDDGPTGASTRRITGPTGTDLTMARGVGVPRLSARLWAPLTAACELTAPVRELLASEGIDPAVAVALGCRDPWPVRAELHALLAGADRVELQAAGLLDPRGGSIWRELRDVCEGDTATRGLLVPVWWPGQSAPRRWFWWPGTTAVASHTPAPGVFGSALSSDDNTGPVVLVETVRDWLRVASAIDGAGLTARVVGLERRLSKLPAPVAAAVDTAPLTVALGPEAGDSWRALTDAIEDMPRQGAMRWGRYTAAPGDRDGLGPVAVDLLIGGD